MTTPRPRVRPPFLLGLGAAVIIDALACGMMMTASAQAERKLGDQQEARRVVTDLPFPGWIRDTTVSTECITAGIDICLHSTQSPPRTMAWLDQALAAHGTVTERACVVDSSGFTREELRRCHITLTIGMATVQVSMWPHIAAESELTPSGTDVWIDLSNHE